MKPLLAIAIVALSALLASCGAAGKASKPTEGRDEILMLDGKILEWRREMGLGPSPPDNLWKKFWNSPGAPIPTPIPAVVPDACRDVCTLSDYICQAKDDICRIAHDLGDDDWAQRKCANAKASCEEARKKCADCARKSAVDPSAAGLELVPAGYHSSSAAIDTCVSAAR